MKLSEALEYGKKHTSRRNAVYLLCSLGGFSTEDVYLRNELEVTDESFGIYMEKIHRLSNGEPLQYVLGKWDFCGLEFLTDERALVPRPETELLVEAVLGSIKGKEGLDILDVCTGSGCVGLSVAKLADSKHNVSLADISQEALELAAENRKLLGLEYGVSLYLSDLLDHVPGEFDVIVSNPPYLTKTDMESLPDNVRKFEPHLALDGGTDGLAIYKRLVPQSYARLRPGGTLFLEIGPPGVVEIAESIGFRNIEIIKDYAHFDRILQGVK